MKTQTPLIMLTIPVLISMSLFAPTIYAKPASGSSETYQGVAPSQLVAYVNQQSGSGCVSGTLDPFTITSTACPESSNAVVNRPSSSSYSAGPIPASTYGITCSGVCLAGTDDSASNYYGLWQAFATVPTVPSNLYTSSPYVSEWMGLSTCVPSCTGTVVQGGISFGSGDGATNSHNPGLWVEYLATSGTCSTSFCGNYMSTSQGDSDYWEMYYTASQWLLYGQDSSTNPGTYVTYYTSGPPSTLQYGLTSVEGHAATSAGDWPGTITFTSVIGEDSSGTLQLGTQGANFASPSGSSLTASISYSTTTCLSTHTCATIGLGVT